KAGTVQHIITTVEQLFKTSEGHLPCLSVNIDEAQFIHVAGLLRYRDRTFQPAWGWLDELKAMLPNTVPWRALSVTLLPHILKTVEAKIPCPMYITINSSSNQLNTTYATHQLASCLEDSKNYECFLTKPVDLSAQPCILIFFDNKTLASNVVKHPDKQLPTEYQSTGIVRHYHSGMSDAYLQMVHTAFTECEGQCKTLCVTSGESMGVDFPDVQIVCNAGPPSNIVEALQHGGWVGQHEGDKGLFVIFYEPW
ncbi:hypothetical protein L208DRAFT_1000576, partial [Tricholoma matsutake]